MFQRVLWSTVSKAAFRSMKTTQRCQSFLNSWASELLPYSFKHLSTVLAEKYGRIDKHFSLRMFYYQTKICAQYSFGHMYNRSPTGGGLFGQEMRENRFTISIHLRNSLCQLVSVTKQAVRQTYAAHLRKCMKNQLCVYLLSMCVQVPSSFRTSSSCLLVGSLSSFWRRLLVSTPAREESPAGGTYAHCLKAILFCTKNNLVKS